MIIVYIQAGNRVPATEPPGFNSIHPAVGAVPIARLNCTGPVVSVGVAAIRVATDQAVRGRRW
jgi:hypothetical protein